MSEMPYLTMRRPNLDNLPPLFLPQGFSLHNHSDELVSVWEKIIEESFETPIKFDECVKSFESYKPEHVLYICKNGEYIATATTIEHKTKYPGEGLFHMIGAASSARGTGAGRLACIAALHAIAAQGYKTAVLSTDDFRIPAISLYLSLGFEPVMWHESHKERWDKIYEKINERKK